MTSIMQTISYNKQNVTGVILAGGQARRMAGKDKGLLELAHKPMIEYVLAAFSGQVGPVIINANRNQSVYARYHYPVVSDQLDGYCGPLAGIASAMQHCRTEFMVTVPCDSPLIPDNLVQRLFQALREQDTELSVAHNGERLQPVFTLLKCKLIDSIMDYLTRGERKIDRWFSLHSHTVVDFSDQPDTFLNINTPEDLALLEQKLRNHNNENK